ncbi:MAG: hypothetical protein D3908_14860 [Candidatus Electrothrix sp. AUS4]|nr:hypothetical protein [Candidatus Electrothrix sp. AUS4]
MRYIEKHSTEPEGFRLWMKSHSKANWNDFSTCTEHRELREQLLTEQVGMCCYCEVMVTVADSHIEHLKPLPPITFPKEQIK